MKHTQRHDVCIYKYLLSIDRGHVEYDSYPPICTYTFVSSPRMRIVRKAWNQGQFTYIPRVIFSFCIQLLFHMSST